ncbi:MAG TPA: hypothetical protein VMF09_16425 [Solirubrobacteraceae bacterium]|nr:hypothetical protein [Solirubrobacteraceae bacterium]
MSLFAKKVVGVTLAVAVVGLLIALYVADWATSFPTAVSASVNPASAGGGTKLTLETVGAVGKKYGSDPDWVSYLIRSHGQWVHSTIYTVPADSVVHVTLYEFDSPTGLRNPLFSEVRGTVGGTMTINGKTVNSVGPEEPAHTFAIPELGVFVPLPGVNEEAKNFCEEGPCEPATQEHNTIKFSFRTGKKGRYRWQCFVPCGAGFINGNGGPMQTLGYMDGFIDVV